MILGDFFSGDGSSTLKLRPCRGVADGGSSIGRWNSGNFALFISISEQFIASLACGRL